MKISAIRLLLTITLSFAGGGGALAQESGIDPDADCAAVLAAPPFVDMLTRDFGQLDSRFQGAALHGLECSREELDRYFEEAGWGYPITNSFDEPLGPSGELQYYTDSFVSYCQKSRTLFSLYFLKCSRVAGISFLEGKITNLNVGGTK